MKKIMMKIDKSDERFKMVIAVAEDVAHIGGRLYLVGGIVRDMKLNKKNKDIDVEIHGISPETFLNILLKYGEVDKIGASFGIYKIKGIDIDFAMPRTEIKTGETHKDFEVSVDPFIGIEDACRRRDFTINSIVQDLLNEEIIDCFGGIKDLDKQLIRHVDNETFVEDPLRVFRACQFSARFEFEIADETKTLCSKMDLSLIARERVFEELSKAIKKAKRPSIFFRELKSINKLSPFFSELEEITNFKFEKIMNDIDNSNHDITNVFSVIAFNLDVPTYERFINKISTEIIYTKIIPVINQLIKSNLNITSDTQLRQLAYDSIKFSNEFIDAYILNKGLNEESSISFKSKFLKAKEEIIIPLVQGRDLIECGIKPGKEMGRMVKEAMNLQIQGIKDKNKILDIVLKKEV